MSIKKLGKQRNSVEIVHMNWGVKLNYLNWSALSSVKSSSAGQFIFQDLTVLCFAALHKTFSFMNNRCFPYHEQMYLYASFSLGRLKKTIKKDAQPKKRKLKNPNIPFTTEVQMLCLGPIKLQVRDNVSHWRTLKISSTQDSLTIWTLDHCQLSKLVIVLFWFFSTWIH